jgi:hypothetical protein
MIEFVMADSAHGFGHPLHGPTGLCMTFGGAALAFASSAVCWVVAQAPGLSPTDARTAILAAISSTIVGAAGIYIPFHFRYRLARDAQRAREARERLGERIDASSQRIEFNTAMISRVVRLMKAIDKEQFHAIESNRKWIQAAVLMMEKAGIPPPPLPPGFMQRSFDNPTIRRELERMADMLDQLGPASGDYPVVPDGPPATVGPDTVAKGGPDGQDQG